MSNYKIMIKNVDINPEFGVDKEIEDGFESNEFILVSKNDERIHVAVNGFSVDDMSELFAKHIDEKGITEIVAAGVMAETKRRVGEIFVRRDKKEKIKNILGGLM